jgi:hypothetical protein
VPLGCATDTAESLVAVLTLLSSPSRAPLVDDDESLVVVLTLLSSCPQRR